MTDMFAVSQLIPLAAHPHIVGNMLSAICFYRGTECNLQFDKHREVDMVFGKKSQLLAVLTARGLLILTNTVFAQDNPETGDISEEKDSASVGGEWSGSLEGQTSTDSASDSTSQWQADSTADTSDIDSGTSSSGSDHDSVVGSFGIGFFGISEIPVYWYPISTPIEDSIPVPTLGVRYWLSSLLGIEAALGIGWSSYSAEDEIGTEIDMPSFFGFALHGGLPLALAHAGHFTFEVIPDINFGVSTGSEENISTGSPEDIDSSGILFQIGGRLGAELQFGFVGVPQLSLLTTFGAHFSYESRSASVQGGDRSEDRLHFGTTIGSEPWRSFMGSINLIYYI